MSTLASIEWPQAPVVAANGTSAARALRSYVWAKGGAKSDRELKALGEKVPGARWRDFMRLHLFERVDWGDGSPASVSTVATLCGCSQAIDNAMLLMISLRAEQQAGSGSRVKTRYRVVVELEHVTANTVCWLDVETGEVIAGDVWSAAEEKRLAMESGVAA